jgi:hypothetical protein
MVVTGITDAQSDGSDESDESDELDADDLAEAVLEFHCASSLSVSPSSSDTASEGRCSGEDIGLCDIGE